MRFSKDMWFMNAVKNILIDGESIHVSNSAIYLFQSSNGCTLELDIIVSEVAIKKYQKEDTLIVEIELEDGQLISSIMHVKVLPGRLPQLNLFCEVNDMEEYPNFQIVNENDSEFPNVEEGITIEAIRKVEMPMEKINLKLNLPIDQVEWLQKHKRKELNEIFVEMISDYWHKQQKD